MSSQTPDGMPCWYELHTSDLDGAGDFYTTVLNWTTADAGMPGMTYHLATAPSGANVAGMSSLADTDEASQSQPPSWLVYFTTADCDAAVAAISADGGTAMVPPTEIPGTGRFAICVDPQGAVFGLLQPLPMDTPPEHSAFERQMVGHGGWHELMTTDPDAGFAFYAQQFGWTKGETIPMGPGGQYQLFQLDGADLGGMMALGKAPTPAWLPYFGVDGVTAAVKRITDGGGSVEHGPVDVPGGAFVAVARDPQGAWFAVVGPE